MSIGFNIINPICFVFQVYFTHNMKVVGKVLSYVPVGGFYPTVHIFSQSAIKMNVDLNPPVS